MVLSILHLRSHFGMRFAPYPSKALGMERSPKPRTKNRLRSTWGLHEGHDIPPDTPNLHLLAFSKEKSLKIWPLASLCDLFGMVKWPFQMVKWHPTEKVTLNHLAHTFKKIKFDVPKQKWLPLILDKRDSNRCVPGKSCKKILPKKMVVKDGDMNFHGIPKNPFKKITN